MDFTNKSKVLTGHNWNDWSYLERAAIASNSVWAWSSIVDAIAKQPAEPKETNNIEKRYLFGQFLAHNKLIFFSLPELQLKQSLHQSLQIFLFLERTYTSDHKIVLMAYVSKNTSSSFNLSTLSGMLASVNGLACMYSVLSNNMQ